MIKFYTAGDGSTHYYNDNSFASDFIVIDRVASAEEIAKHPVEYAAFTGTVLPQSITGASPVLTISGTPAVGSALTAALPIGWTAGSYQWTRNGASISGATSSIYTLVSADSTNTVGCTVTGLAYAGVGLPVGITSSNSAPVITTPGAITSAVAGTPVTWSAASATGLPAPSITYDILLSGTPVATNATSGVSYTAVNAGDSLTLRTNATNIVAAIQALSASYAVTAAPALPVITTAAVITAAVAGSAPTFSNAASTSTPVPAIAYVLQKNSSVVATGATAIAAYTSTVAGDILTIGATPTNANGTGATVYGANFTVTSAGNGIPSPSLSLDFTSAVPSQVTFSRSSASTAIVNGVVTSISSGAPAIESWKSVTKGLRVYNGGQNLLSYSNVFSNAAWTASASANSAGSTPGPDGSTVMGVFTEDSTTNYHGTYRTIASVAAGTTQTFSCIVRRPASATRVSMFLRMGNQYDNTGSRLMVRFDSSFGYYLNVDPTNQTNCSGRATDLGNGFYRLQVTGTWNAAGTKAFGIYTSNGSWSTFTGDSTNNFEVYGAQVTSTLMATSYVDNPSTALNSVATETAIFNDTSWLTQSQGTIVIEHTALGGTLLGSGTNTVIPASAAGKTAFAWSGSTSDLVNNGSTSTTGANPTWGSDVRILGTSALQSFGHIKSMKYYASRLTVAQMQTLTAPASTASNGAWRVATTRARLPAHSIATSGTQLSFVCRAPVPLTNLPLSKLRYDFANWVFPGNAFNGNSFVIDECYLERTTNTIETVPVKVSGATSFTINNTTNNQVTDSILPSSFTGLSSFSSSDTFYVWLRGHVTTAAMTLPGSRWVIGNDAGVQGYLYDPATSGPTNTTHGIGSLNMSGTFGTNYNAMTQIVCPIVTGTFVSGDPKTVFITGDSIVEGVGATQGYTWTEQACADNNIPCVTMCLGGQSQTVINGAGQLWLPYMQYARVLLDEMGTNATADTQSFYTYWTVARNTYNYDKIGHVGMTPRTTTPNVSVSSITGNGTTATLTTTAAFVAAIGSVGATAQAVVGGATGSAAGYNTGTAGATMTVASTTTLTYPNPTTATSAGTITICDNFSTVGNQVVFRTFPQEIDNMWAACAASGQLDYNHNMTSTRDSVSTDKWMANGTMNYYTVDGEHMSPNGNALLRTEVGTLLSSINVSS